MSTRSHIGIENEDGTIDFVYCHFDGYPEGIGAELINMNYDEARKLINEGNMSYIGKPYSPYEAPTRVENKTDYEKDRGWADYLYLITKDGTWFYLGRSKNKFKLLTLEICGS